MKTKMIIAFFLLIGLLSGCGYWDGLNATSEIIKYKGNVSISDNSSPTNLRIYAQNLEYEILDNSGEPISSATYPDTNGDFKIELTTKTHPVSDPIEHWECGPLRILIEGDSIVTYYDSLTNDQLRTLPQNETGEWVLPTITLQKK
jgi:hypothetical protein